MQNLKNSLNMGEIGPDEWHLIKESCQVSKTSIRRWKEGKGIKKQYWKRIEKVLNLEPGTMQNYCMEKYRHDGLIKICKICKKEFKARLKRVKVCSDQCRKKNKQSRMKGVFKAKPKMLFKRQLGKPENKNETRERIKAETINYLKSGKEILKLKPEPVYFTYDQFELDLEFGNG